MEIQTATNRIGYGLDDRSSIPEGKMMGFFFSATACRPTVGPTQPQPLNPRVKRPGSEADHSLPPSAEVKNEWSYTSIPTVRLYGVMLNYA
jgi:hypothetical protein